MRLAAGLFLAAVALHAQSAEPARTESIPAPSKGAPLDPLRNSLPRWLSVSAEERLLWMIPWDEELVAGRRENFVLSRLRLNLLLSTGRFFKAGIQVHDARGWGKIALPRDPRIYDPFDLRQLFVELGDLGKGPVGLRAGRQDIIFGDRWLIGDANWLNSGRSYDAVRLGLSRRLTRVDVFAASVVLINGNAFDRRQDGNNIHGVYLSTRDLWRKRNIEAYGLWRLAPVAVSESGKLGRLDTKTGGVRAVGPLAAGFDFEVELAWQGGSRSADHVNASASHLHIGRLFETWPLRPRLFFDVNYASGDRARGDGESNSFDRLYQSAHDRVGLADQFSWRNVMDLRYGADLVLRRGFTVTPSIHEINVASLADAVYGSRNLPVFYPSPGAVSKRVAREFDLAAQWSLGRGSRLLGGFAHVFPLALLKQGRPGAAPQIFYLGIIQQF